MKTSLVKSGKCLSWIILTVALAWSCQKENVRHETPEQAQAQNELTAQDNSAIIATTQDLMDVTAGAMTGQNIEGRSSSYGRMNGSDMNCAPNVSLSFTINRSDADSIVYSGSLTIDYGTGVSCKDSTEIRKGKITDSFVYTKTPKDSITFNLSETITLQGFQKDSVALDGTFIIKSSSGRISTLDIQNARIVYADGTFVSWSGNLTSTFLPGPNSWDFLRDNAKEITGSIMGKSRAGLDFSAMITKGILFKYSCSHNIPVSGTIQITNGSIVSDIDYGTGTCDKAYTITTGGVTKDYTFKRHGDN